MEDKESSVPLYTVDAETEFQPFREVANAVDAAVTAFSTDENPARNGGDAGGGGAVALGSGANGIAEGKEADSTVWRKRGRPKGSGNKLRILASLDGLAVDMAGSNFTPHAMTIQTGEDIVQKILSFSQGGPRSICILSATGAISSVDIHQPGPFGGVLRYEGRFEILTLSGSHAHNDMGALCHKACLLSISLANPDGRVFGGAVAGSLIAAGPIQLVVASFKPNMNKKLKTRHSVEPSIATGMLYNTDAATFGAPDGKTTDTENCLKPVSPIPEPLFEVEGNAISGQNGNHACFQNVEWSASQPSEPTSDHSTSDIGSGVPK